MDDYIFFIYRGTCKILYPTEQIKENIAFGGIIDEAKQKYIVLGHLEKGDMFGEQSALNDLPHPYTLVAASPKLEYYKIQLASFTNKFFGGLEGSQINQSRG